MSEHDEVPTFSLGRGDAMRWMMAMRAGADLMRTVRESRGRAAFEDAENVARIEAVAAENGLRKLSADDTEQWNAAAAAGRVYAEQHPESGMTVRIAPLSGGRYGVQAGWEDNYTSTVVGSAKMAGELRSWLNENSNYSSIDDLRGTVEELHQHQINLAAQTAQERATFEREESRRVEIARWLHQPEQARVRAMWENTSHPEFRGENGFEESRRKFWLNGVFQHAQKHNGDLAKATEWALEHDKEFYGDWRRNAPRVNFQNFEEPEMRDAERKHELALIGRWASAFAADKEFEAAQAWASEHDPALYQNWQRAQAQATGLDETRRGEKTLIDAVSVSKELSAAKAWMKKAGNEQVALDWEFPDAHTWQGEDGVQAQWLRGQWHASEAYIEGLSEAEQIEEANAWMALPRNEKIAAEFDEPSTQTWEDFREEWLRGRWRDAQAEAAQAAQDAPPSLTLADRLEGRVDQSILGDKKWATAERQFTALVRDGADPDRLADVVAGITFNEKIRSPSGYASWQMREAATTGRVSQKSEDEAKREVAEEWLAQAQPGHPLDRARAALLVGQIDESFDAKLAGHYPGLLDGDRMREQANTQAARHDGNADAAESEAQRIEYAEADERGRHRSRSADTATYDDSRSSSDQYGDVVDLDKSHGGWDEDIPLPDEPEPDEPIYDHDVGSERSTEIPFSQATSEESERAFPLDEVGDGRTIAEARAERSYVAGERSAAREERAQGEAAQVQPTEAAARAAGPLTPPTGVKSSHRRGPRKPPGTAPSTAARVAKRAL
ncbi:MAG: hypothetical protein V7694_21645 [Rhodococcus sp. (in: high G+C Gram-positive bacteria)]